MSRIGVYGSMIAPEAQGSLAPRFSVGNTDPLNTASPVGTALSVSPRLKNIQTSDSTSYSFNPYRRFTLSSISGVVSRARISAFRRLSSWMISGVLMLAALRLLAALSAPWRAF
jgi:hypothetical protein